MQTAGFQSLIEQKILKLTRAFLSNKLSSKQLKGQRSHTALPTSIIRHYCGSKAKQEVDSSLEYGYGLWLMA
jgi:hypothetical protein